MVKWRPIQISLTLLIHFSYSQYQEYPHWVRFSVNNIDKNRWFSFYCYFFASNVQLFERECQWFEFQRCERKRKMVNYRDKLSWTGNKWETLEMADSVLFFCVCKHKTALIFAPYAIWRALRAEQCGGQKQPRRNKKNRYEKGNRYFCCENGWETRWRMTMSWSLHETKWAIFAFPACSLHGRAKHMNYKNVNR